MGGVLNQLQDDREVVIAYARRSLRFGMPAVIPSTGTVLHVGKCWRRFLCALTFVRTFGEHSSLCALIIVRSDGSRIFGTVMECWPDGICCLASFRLRLNTAQELNTLMQMAFLVNVANVRGRTVRCPRRRGRPEASVQRWHCWFNRLPLLPWGFDGCWSFATYLEEVTAALEPAGLELDFITAYWLDNTLITVRKWVRHHVGRTVLDCPRSCDLGSCNLEIYQLIRTIFSGADECRRRRHHSWLVPLSERQSFIQWYHDSIFTGHLGVSRTVYRLLDRVNWPGLHEDVRSYISSCSVCLARKSPCHRRAPMGHVSVGHRWDRVAMDILDMPVTTSKGNRYVLVMVDCFSPAR